MNTSSLTDDDRALVAEARETNERVFDPEFFDGGHAVTAAIRTADGTVYEGCSLPASIGRAQICGEPVAIGSAITDGYRHDEIRTCVAVAYPLPGDDGTGTRVFPPCGPCRELLADYNGEMRVVVPVEGDNRVVRANDLLPTRPW